MSRIVFPAPIMPCQFADLFRARVNDGESRLILAVLEGAIWDMLANKPNRRLDAREWISATNTSLMSFHWCCEALGIEPATLRNQVLSGSMNRLPRRSPSQRGRIAQLGAPRAYGNGK